jgi:hypothetical protein
METLYLFMLIKTRATQENDRSLIPNLYGHRHVGRTQQNIFVEHVVLGVRRSGVLKFVRKVGAVLAEQVAHYFGIPVEEARRLLDELVERGELRAVEIAGLKFYFVDPKEAAEVILGSIKPD